MPVSQLFVDLEDDVDPAALAAALREISLSAVA